MSSDRVDRAEIHRAISLFFEPGTIVELRALEVGGKTHAGYFSDFEELASEAAKLGGAKVTPCE